MLYRLSRRSEVHTVCLLHSPDYFHYSTRKPLICNCLSACHSPLIHSVTFLSHTLAEVMGNNVYSILCPGMNPRGIIPIVLNSNAPRQRHRKPGFNRMAPRGSTLADIYYDPQDGSETSDTESVCSQIDSEERVRLWNHSCIFDRETVVMDTQHVLNKQQSMDVEAEIIPCDASELFQKVNIRVNPFDEMSDEGDHNFKDPTGDSGICDQIDQDYVDNPAFSHIEVNAGEELGEGLRSISPQGGLWQQASDNSNTCHQPPSEYFQEEEMSVKDTSLQNIPHECLTKSDSQSTTEYVGERLPSNLDLSKKRVSFQDLPESIPLPANCDHVSRSPRPKRKKPLKKVAKWSEIVKKVQEQSRQSEAVFGVSDTALGEVCIISHAFLHFILRNV